MVTTNQLMTRNSLDFFGSKKSKVQDGKGQFPLRPTQERAARSKTPT